MLLQARWAVSDLANPAITVVWNQAYTCVTALVASSNTRHRIQPYVRVHSIDMLCCAGFKAYRQNRIGLMHDLETRLVIDLAKVQPATDARVEQIYVQWLFAGSVVLAAKASFIIGHVLQPTQQLVQQL